MRISTNMFNIIDDETSIEFRAQIVAIVGDMMTIEIESVVHVATFDNDMFAWRIVANDENGWSCDLMIMFHTSHVVMFHDV